METILGSRHCYERCVTRLLLSNETTFTDSSDPAEGMDVCLLCLCVVLSCVGRGLCDGLITRPEESYRVSNCV
jgi:hypothetical protein